MGTALTLTELLLHIDELYRPSPAGHWRKRLERRSKAWLARPDARLHWDAAAEAADAAAVRLPLPDRAHPPTALCFDGPLAPEVVPVARALAQQLAAVIALMADLTPAGEVPPRWRTALTDRQIQAAVLAADGLSNDEVADQLGIAPRTVARLLQDVYRRLGVSGRAAVAAEMALMRPPTPFVASISPTD